MSEAAKRGGLQVQHTQAFVRRSHLAVQLLAVPNCLHSLLPGSVANEGCETASTQNTKANIPRIRNVIARSLAAPPARSTENGVMSA
jgi:hypothetical protein